MQIDKLVQLLESPIFIQLRLQLLETHAPYHANLMKSLYGLLMLLPAGWQSVFSVHVSYTLELGVSGHCGTGSRA